MTLVIAPSVERSLGRSSAQDEVEPKGQCGATGHSVFLSRALRSRMLSPVNSKICA